MFGRFVSLSFLFCALGPFFITCSATGQQPNEEKSHPGDYRIWTDRSGEHRTEAAFVELKDGKVTLRKQDGKTIKIPLEKLSDEDQEFVRRATSAKEPDAKESVSPKKKPATPAPKWFLFTNKNSGEVHRGKILDRGEFGGVSKYFVEGEDGQKAWIVAREWKVAVDKSGNAEEQSDSSDKREDRSSVKINPSSSTTGSGKQMTVVATGVGTDPDKAKYNALSNAIEQVVGVLVDAETLVENDKLIREKVLTYTESDITAVKVLDQWQKDDLHYVRVKATVATQKLESRLREQHVAMREVDGEVFYDNAKRRQENAKNFSEMLAGALHDFGADKMVKPEIVGKPEVVGQNDQFTTMSVKVITKPDMENWKKFRTDILRLLRNIRRAGSGSIMVQDKGRGDKESGFFSLGQRLGGAEDRMEQMAGNAHGHWILILQGYMEGKEAETMLTQWMAYQIDKSIGPVFEGLQKQEYRLHVRLLGKNNNVIAEDERLFSEHMHCSYRNSPYRSLYQDDGDYRHKYDAYYLSPFFWKGDDYCPAMPAQEFRISVPVNDLPDVSRVTATIERIKQPQK